VTSPLLADTMTSVGAAEKSSSVLPDDTSAETRLLRSPVALTSPELDTISTGPSTSTRVVRPLDTLVRSPCVRTPRTSRFPELAESSTA
jgi:hypothetical protein